MPAAKTRPAVKVSFPEREPATPTVTAPATPPAISVSTARRPNVLIMRIISVRRSMWIFRAVEHVTVRRPSALLSRKCNLLSVLERAAYIHPEYMPSVHRRPGEDLLQTVTFIRRSVFLRRFHLGYHIGSQLCTREC